MPATIDDLASLLTRLNASMDDLLANQKNRQKQAHAAHRSAQRKAMRHPRRQLASGMRDMMNGRFARGWKKWKSAWKSHRAGSMAGKAAGPLLVVAAFAALRKAVIATTDAMIKSARQYEYASASMAVVFAQREFSELKRDIRKGEAIAPSTDALVKAEQRRKDSHESIDVLGAKLGNYFMAGVNNIASVMLEPLNKLAEAINEMIDKMPGARTAPANLSEWAADVEGRQRKVLIDDMNMLRDVAAAANAARNGFPGLK